MLKAETGLSRKQIESWAKNFRFVVQHDERYTRLANPEKDYDQVNYAPCTFASLIAAHL